MEVVHRPVKQTGNDTVTSLPYHWYPISEVKSSRTTVNLRGNNRGRPTN